MRPSRVVLVAGFAALAACSSNSPTSSTAVSQGATTTVPASEAPTTAAAPAGGSSTSTPATPAPTNAPGAATATTVRAQPTTAPTAAPPTTKPPAPTTTQAGTVALEVASSASHGQYLVSAANHHAVYLFTQDKGTTSACTGACAIYWPPAKAPAHPVGGAGVDSAKISVVNGQLAYNGHLLYEYSGDSAPGQTNGTSVQDWFLVSPAGTKA